MKMIRHDHERMQKKLPLAGFEPGQYTIKVTATDRKRNQTVTQSAPFTVLN